MTPSPGSPQRDAAPRSPGGRLEAADTGEAARHALGPWRAALLERLESRGGYRSWVLFAALAGMFATSFPITILAVSLAPIAVEFGSSETTMAWVVSGPMLLSAVSFPLLGKLGDLRGHRTVFLLGFAGATAVAALTAFSWDAPSLIAFRTLAAMLGGATQPTAMALIFSVHPPEERVRAMGWWSMTTAAAPALGLVAGGPLVDLFGWRIVFLFQAALSAVALALAVVVLRETPRKRVRFDVWGSAALAVGIGGFMFAVGSLRDLAHGPERVIASAVVGLLGLVAFVAVERRVEAPLLPLEFFRSRHFTATLLTNAFTSAAYMGSFIVAPMLLGFRGYSVTAASYLILIRTATLTLASPVGGRLGERMGERWASVVGCALLTLGCGLVALAAMTWSLGLFVLGLVAQGAGHGLSQPSITAAIARSVEEGDLGIAAAANRLMGQGGAAFGITVLTLAYGGDARPEAFAFAFATGAGLSALSVAAATFMGIQVVHPGHASPRESDARSTSSPR